MKTKACNKMSPDSESSHFCGFQTGRGNIVKVSDKALEEAKSLLGSEIAGRNEAFEGDSLKTKTTDTVTCGAESNQFPGFRTGQGNTVKVSDKALNQAKSLLGSEIHDPCLTTEGNFLEAKSANKVTGDSGSHGSSRFYGFQTGRGNTVKVSDKALQQAKSMLGSELCEPNDSLEGDVLKPKACKNTSYDSGPRKFCGFQTAKGSTVSVSEKALQKARGVLAAEAKESKDCDMLYRSTDKTQQNGKNTVAFTGFTTGKGQHVSVSKEALEQTKEMWSNVNCSGPTAGDEREGSTRKHHVDSPGAATEPPELSGRVTADPAAGKFGHSTATPKESILDVSLEALESTRALLADGDDFGDLGKT